MTRLPAPLAIVATLMFGASPVDAQVFQCIGPDGQKRFQQSPCDAKMSGRMEVKPASGDAPPVSAMPAGPRRVSPLERAHDERAAASQGEIFIGMSEAMAIEAWGQPLKVNTDVYGGSVRRQMIYRRSTGDRYVYTENGVVTAIQDRPRVVVRRGAPCPSKLEIANARTSANSITLSVDERRQRQREIERMESCRDD